MKFGGDLLICSENIEIWTCPTSQEEQEGNEGEEEEEEEESRKREKKNESEHFYHSRGTLETINSYRESKSCKILICVIAPVPYWLS